jgi:hypothetical protein
MSKSKNVRDLNKIDWAHVRAELADSIQAAKDENITLIRYNSKTGEAWRISPDGKIEPYEVGRDQSDWARNAAMTDEEIEAAIAADADEVSLGVSG